MSAPGSISQLLAFARQGDSVATTALVGRFFERLADAAEALLRQRNSPRRAADGEDVAVQALKSVVVRLRRGDYPNLADRDSFWGLLLKVAERKAANLARDEMRKKRGGGTVKGEEVFGSPDESFRRSLDDFPAADPTPVEALAVHETIEQLIDAVKDEPKLEQIARMLLNGHKLHEIQTTLGISKATLMRKVARLRAALRDLLDDVPDEESS